MEKRFKYQDEGQIEEIVDDVVDYNDENISKVSTFKRTASGFNPPKLSEDINNTTFLQQKAQNMHGKILTSKYLNGYFEHKADTMKGKIDYWRTKNEGFNNNKNTLIKEESVKNNILKTKKIHKVPDFNDKIKNIIGFRNK